MCGNVYGEPKGDRVAEALFERARKAPSDVGGEASRICFCCGFNFRREVEREACALELGDFAMKERRF